MNKILEKIDAVIEKVADDIMKNNFKNAQLPVCGRYFDGAEHKRQRHEEPA